MRKLISTLASMKVTVVLIILIGFVLAAGTIVESRRGTEAARAVYYAPWFYALQGFFAVNITCALIQRWPRNRWRIGFAVTHLSMIVILAGALITDLYKLEGQMPIEEGQQSNFIHRDGDGQTPPITLPFSIHLQAFEMDLYPGTGRPAMYRSRVEVVEPSGGGRKPAVIEMNKPLSHGGYSFFQSSYQIAEGRRMTILSVSKDPGQPIVFLGYVLLVGGMIIVFATRLVQFRQAAQAGASAVLVAALLGASPDLSAAGGAQAPSKATLESLRSLPVQHDGRTMPLDTQAREAVRTVTGRSSWGSHDPVALVAGWMFDPEHWQNEPLVKVGGSRVAAAIGLKTEKSHASLAEILSSPGLQRAVQAAHIRQDREQKPGPLDRDLLKLEDRLSTLYQYFKKVAVHPIPSPDPKGSWESAANVGTPEALAAIASQIRASSPPAHYPSEAEIVREIRYNAVRPTRIAWLLLLPAAIVAILNVNRDTRPLRILGGALLVAGFATMTWGLATRWQIAGRIPASDMYESMLFLGWGVGLFSIIALLLRQKLLIANAAGMGALAMMLTDLLPMDPFIHPMAPVLSGTPWLAIHVPIIVVSYSVLAMATGLAHLIVGVEIWAPARRDLAARWSELLYWYLHVGSILLIAGILTGSIWAASSWGRYWGWDPKEVWSLIAFLAYMAILHARIDDQMRDFGVAAASIAAFSTILMTYLGVNFVLSAGLHSYGFGASNLGLLLAGFAVLEIAFLFAGWDAYRRRLALEDAEAATA
ncbi:MAG: cytochrome c biogenesis protein ResB [Thermoanaerobaculia bacterium]|nr:cytochrome c biogenesis protein ResB [Thermoanaerobaculia bacterium]